MLKQGALLRELQSIVGKKHVREPKDGHDCAVDGMSPQAVVDPGTYEEVAEVLRFANVERLAVIPSGAGSQMHFGNVPSRYDVALSLGRLDKVIEHEPADLTVTCQAGVTVGALGDLLTQAGQMVPLAPAADSSPPPLTVGGLLALNMGYMQPTHGRPRDFTIGLKVVTGDGRISGAGGKVVKNVAGYDLCKLYIGSRGTLAIILEATFKLFPRPETQESISFEFADCLDACRTALEARSRGLALVEASLIPSSSGQAAPTRPDRYVLHLAFAGEPSMIQRSRGEAHDLATRFSGKEIEWRPHGGSTKEPGESPGFEHPLSVRTHLLPMQAPDFIRTMANTAGGLFDANPLVGEVNWIWTYAGDPLARIEAGRKAADRLGGTLEVQFCSPELKRQIDVFGPPPPSLPLMRAIKQQFDPNNVLSPGRFVGRL